MRASFSTEKSTNDKYDRVFQSDSNAHTTTFTTISILVDAAAVDNGGRLSPENNLDFYAYSQGAPYSVNVATPIFAHATVFIRGARTDAATDRR